MKVVIISRYIYPAIAPRPMRATELAKEFARQGHDVRLYGIIGDYDYTNFEKKHKLKVKSLGNLLFHKGNSSKFASSNSILIRGFTKIFGKFLEFPDIELSQKVYKVLKDEEGVDLLITVAIPYPLHWGVALYKTLNKNALNKTIWVADCGDPYMGNPLSHHPFYFKYIEKWFCRKADFITVPIEEAKKAYYPEFKNKIKVIPQGFNFEEINLKKLYQGNPCPTFIYAGVFYKEGRNPEPLLDFLSTLELEFKFIVYTKSIKLIEPYIEKLKNKLIVNPYVTRKELLEAMARADFLLNLENKTNLQSPSKLIDYTLTGRPILSLNTNKELNTEIILQFLDGNYKQRLLINNIEQYNISNVVAQFIELVNKRKNLNLDS